jgi:hypothetical protein
MILVAVDPADLLDRLEQYSPPAVAKWIDRASA